MLAESDPPEQHTRRLRRAFHGRSAEHVLAVGEVALVPVHSQGRTPSTRPPRQLGLTAPPTRPNSASSA
jgi:hypothetical protein